MNRIFVFILCLTGHLALAQEAPIEVLEFPSGTFNAPEWTITFNTDGQYQVALMDGTAITGTYEVEGNQVKVQDTSCGDLVGVYTWTLEEDKLTVNVVDDPCTERGSNSNGLVMTRADQ